MTWRDRLPKRDGTGPSPVLLKWFHWGRMVFWFVIMPIIPFLHLNLQKLAIWILEVSLYANGASDFTNWQAARAEIAASRRETEDA